MTLLDYEPTVEWNPYIRHYEVEVVLDTGRETLVFDTLKKAQTYRLEYLADVQNLLAGGEAIFGSGAIL